jgi:hypothetical protein
MVPLYGEITKTDLFYRTDSIRNILSNKLTALTRLEGKDVADIREITLHETIDWATIIKEARQKEAGLDFTYIANLMTSMPQSEFETIAWTKKPDLQEFRNDTDRIAYEMMSGERF